LTGGGPGGEAASRFDVSLGRMFRVAGAVPATTPLLQRAEPYLDTAGEDLRRRIFLTRGEGGETLCLRPDFTIPVCLAHLEAGETLPRSYSYNGPVFRQRGGEAAEFRQAGIENLGEADRAEADARTLADALAGLAACGLEPAAALVVVGDQALFEAFLRGLDLPAGWQRRLVRCFGRDDLLDRALEALARGSPDASSALPVDLLALARAADRDALAARVAALNDEGGLPPNRSRTPEEIVDRLVEKVTLADTRLGGEALERLCRFLALDCALNEAPGRLRDLAGEAGVDLGEALAFLDARNRALAARGVDLAGLRYSAAFGRALDYYTGLVFEIRAREGAEPLAAGGRYDRLLRYLGAREPVPAVGVAFWLDRIEAAVGEARS